MQYLDGGSYHALTERKKERTHCYICLLNIFITFQLHLQMQYCIALVKKTKKKNTSMLQYNKNTFGTVVC